MTYETDLYLKEVIDNFTMVGTLRNDKLTQFLEIQLSEKIGLFHSFDASAYNYPDDNSIRVKKAEVELFALREKEHQKRLQIINNKIVIEHSNITNIESIYNMLGLSDWTKYIDPLRITEQLPKEPSYKNLEKYFKNIEQIEKWMIEAFK